MDEGLLARARKQADLCSIFSSTQRVLILWTLAEGEMTVSEIAAAVDASMQNTSHHLRVMKDRGLVRARRDGQTVRYHLKRRDLACCLLEKKNALPAID